MAFMLMQTPDPLTLKDALPNFSRTTHIFLPINDARNVSVAALTQSAAQVDLCMRVTANVF